MEKIEVVLKWDQRPIERPFESFYLSAIKYRLWRFFIPPVILVTTAYVYGKHPITWIAVGFTALFLLAWVKTYVKFYQTLRQFEAADEDARGDRLFVATREGFGIDPVEGDALIDWKVLARFDESRNFFAFTILGYPTLTVGKRDF